jgi:drug/metabolite transporter (DMT)-like permease
MTLILSLFHSGHRKHITKNIVAGITLGFIGVCFIFHKNLLCGHHFSSQMAVVLATFFYGFATLYYRSHMTHIPPFLSLFWMFLWQVMIMWVLVFLFSPHITWPICHSKTWMSLLWLGVVGGGLAHLINMRLIKTLGALKAANVAYLFPVSAYILGCIFLGESFSLWESVGIAFILGGIYLSKQ